MKNYTFPRSCRSLYQSFLQFSAELTSVFDKETQQSQGGCHVTIVVAVLGPALILICILNRRHFQILQGQE